jgi:hypothetical protein
MECTKSGKNGRFRALFGLYINHRKCRFSLKITRYTPTTFFEEYINFKFCCYLMHCGVIHTCSKFRKPYMPPAARIRVNKCTSQFVAPSSFLPSQIVLHTHICCPTWRGQLHPSPPPQWQFWASERICWGEKLFIAAECTFLTASYIFCCLPEYPLSIITFFLLLFVPKRLRWFTTLFLKKLVSFHNQILRK